MELGLIKLKFRVIELWEVLMNCQKTDKDALDGKEYQNPMYKSTTDQGKQLTCSIDFRHGCKR
jgi:hypothetical protein